MVHIEPPPVRTYRALEQAPRQPLNDIEGTYPFVDFWKDRAIIRYSTKQRGYYVYDDQGRTGYDVPEESQKGVGAEAFTALAYFVVLRVAGLAIAHLTPGSTAQENPPCPPLLQRGGQDPAPQPRRTANAPPQDTKIMQRGGQHPTPTHRRTAKPESTEGGRRVSVLRRQEGAPVLLG